MCYRERATIHIQLCFKPALRCWRPLQVVGGGGHHVHVETYRLSRGYTNTRNITRYKVMVLQIHPVF